MTAADSGPGQHHAENPRPVVATSRLVDPGRPSELGGDRHQGGLEQTAIVQIRDQGSQGMVKDRNLAGQRGSNVEVGIPGAVLQRYEPHTRLDQPPCQQHPHARRPVAVSFAGCGLFLGEIKGRAGRRRVDHPVGLPVERVDRLETRDLGLAVNSLVDQ